MSTRLTQLTVATGADEFLYLYLPGTDKLIMNFGVAFNTATTVTGVQLQLSRGFGPRHPSIPYPYSQAVPFVQDADDDALENVVYDEPVDYNLSEVANDAQAGSIIVDKREMGDYLKVKLLNTDTVAGVVTLDVVVS